MVTCRNVPTNLLHPHTLNTLSTLSLGQGGQNPPSSSPSSRALRLLRITRSVGARLWDIACRSAYTDIHFLTHLIRSYLWPGGKKNVWGATRERRPHPHRCPLWGPVIYHQKHENKKNLQVTERPRAPQHGFPLNLLTLKNIFWDFVKLKKTKSRHSLEVQQVILMTHVDVLGSVHIGMRVSTLSRGRKRPFKKLSQVLSDITTTILFPKEV